MTWNLRRILLGTTISLAVLAACFALGVLPLNLFFLKTTITDAAWDHTGTELHVEGPLRLQLGWKPRLTARDVVVRWPNEPHPLSVSIGDISIQTRLSSAWRGEIDLQELVARGIVFEPGAPGLEPWLPENLRLEAAAPLHQDISLLLEARIGGEDWAARLTGASLDKLLAATQDYPITASLNLPGSDLDFSGSVLLPWEKPGVSGSIDVRSNDLSSLLSRLGREIPGLGPFSLQSEIALSKTTLELNRLSGRLDDFSFELSARVRDWSTRPWFDIKAYIPLIDPAILPAWKKIAADRGEGKPLDLKPVFDRLAAYDGQAEVSIDETRLAGFPLRRLAVTASLDKGLLTLEKASASVSGIDVSARASLDTSVACARLETSFKVPAMDLSILSDVLENDPRLEGSLENSALQTSSCGASPGDHLQSLETEFRADALTLSGIDGREPMSFRNIDAAVNWRNAGRIAFESELMGEALALSAGFGSIEQMSAEALWPVSLDARTRTLELSFSGKTAFHETGLILDLTLSSRFGNSDVSGMLAWSGPGSGLPLKADLRSTLLDLGEFSQLLPDDDAGEPGSIRDWSELLDEADLLQRWQSVPRFDVKLAVDRLEGTAYEIGSLRLDARVEDRQLKNGRMRLGFEGVNLEGALNVDMRAPSALLDYRVNMKNLDVGRLMKAMKLSDTVDAHVEQADMHFKSRGATLRELVGNMSVDSTLRFLRWSFVAGPKSRTFEIALSEVDLHAARGADTIWETRGALNGFPLNARLKTPNLRDVFDQNAPLPLQLIIASRNDITMLDLTAYPETGDGLRSEILLSGRYSNDENVDLSTLPSPLEDYSLRTDLLLRKNEYLASDIDVRVGSSKATGTFRVEPAGRGFLLSLDAGSTFLETDDLVRWVREYREMREFMTAPEEADPGEAPVSAGLLTLVDQYLEEFIGENTWDMQVEISELRSGGSLLGEAAFGLHVHDRGVVLDPATIKLPGGDVSIKYSSAGQNSGWDYRLDVDIDRLEYGGLLRLYDPDSTAEGVIHLDTALHSHAQGPEDSVNHLEGTIDLAVFPENAGARFLDLWASNLILALLPFGENQQKKLNCMVARFEVENGVMTSRNTFLDSTDIIVRARGDIDLARRQLDLLAVPQAKREKFLSVSAPIKATGPFDDFSVRVVSGSFIITMVRWYYGLIYVPWKWLTGERFPADGIATCYRAMDWDVPTEAR